MGESGMEHGNEPLCRRFGEILGAKAKPEGKGCMVSLKRTFDANLQGKQSSSILGVEVLFESLDVSGRALCLAETVVLEQEVLPFSDALAGQGLVISAIHNHWLFDTPRLMYIHVQSVEEPLGFARKMAFAFQGLSSMPVPK